MNKAQGYFGAEARDFNLYARPIPECDLQCQPSATHPHNIKIAFKYDISIGSQTRITVVGKWGFINTLQN